MLDNNIDRIADKLLRLSKEHGADGYEAYVAETKKLSISTGDKKSIENLQADEEHAVAVRTLKEQRLGFSFSFELSDIAVEETFKRALDSGTIMDKQRFLFPENKPDMLAPEAFYDRHIETVSGEDKLETVTSMVDAAHVDKRIIKVERPSYEEAAVSVVVINSSGVLKKSRATRFGISLSVLAREGKESQMSWDFQGANTFSRLKPDRVARNCSEQALQTLGGIQLLTGLYDTMFTQLVVSQFLSVLSKSFLADSVFKRTSLLADKLDQQIFPEHINILDDPTLQDGHGSVPFDAEGTPAVKKIVVAKGTVKSFLCDRYYAALMDTETSGNAVRHSITSPPSIGTTNLVLDTDKPVSGDLKLELSDGPVITELMGLHTVNPVTGDFSLGARGYMIKSGRFSSPLKGITIAGNLFTMFNSIHKAGTDHVLYGHIRTPSVIIKGLKIAGAR